MSSYPNFTPVPSLLGGAMLFASSTSLLASHGKILGVSGLLHNTVTAPLQDALAFGESRRAKALEPWTIAACVGFVTGGVLLRMQEDAMMEAVGAAVFDENGRVGLLHSAAGGLLVGLGTKLAHGCTSGHMLCGVARLSPRSIVATATFFLAALATAQILPTQSTLQQFPPTSPPNLKSSTLLLLQLPFLAYSLVPYILPQAWSLIVSAYFVALHFSFGLALAGMTRPTKVTSFFYFPLGAPFLDRAWDPSLFMVVVSGLVPNAVAYLSSIRHWRKPKHAGSFDIPSRRNIDAKLVGGAALFGVGWILSGGICPGPMLVVLGGAIGQRGCEEIWRYAAGFVAGGLIGSSL